MRVLNRIVPMTNTERVLEALTQLDLARSELLHPSLTSEKISRAKDHASRAHSHLLQCEQSILGVPEPIKGE
jgi:hypothetical protein